MSHEKNFQDAEKLSKIVDISAKGHDKLNSKPEFEIIIKTRTLEKFPKGKVDNLPTIYNDSSKNLLKYETLLTGTQIYAEPVE